METRKTILALAVLAGVLFALLGDTRIVSALPAAETILFNGKILTMDRNFSTAQALAIAGGKILVVSTDQVIRKLAATATRLIDLRGKTVIPSLADNPLHPAGGGPGVDLSGALWLVLWCGRLRSGQRAAP